MRIFQESPRVNGLNNFSRAIGNRLKTIQTNKNLDRCIDRLSADSVDQPSTEYWPITDRYIGQVSTNYRGSVGEVSVNEKLCRPRYIWNDYRPCLDRVSSDYRPSVDRLSTDYRPLYQPSLDRLSTAISTDRSVDSTYSKHDPELLARADKTG